MPSIEKNGSSNLVGAIDSFLDGKKQTATDQSGSKFLSIIDFIDRFKLLPYGLYPIQRFILKLYYNIPLDAALSADPRMRIRIEDPFTKKLLHEMSEVDYLQFLYSQGRCNIKVQDNVERRELILVLGRRSGKSMLASIIAAYEIYKLLCRGHPQQYYGMNPGSEIRVLDVANDKEQAAIVYGEISGYVSQVDYFKHALSNNTLTFMKFQTDNDRKKFGTGPSAKATVTATFKSSIAKGLRGRGIICAILDELAFFVDDGKSSAQRVYEAIVPSLKQFTPKDPKNKHKEVGASEGRVIAISSPDAKEGFFYQLYQMSRTNSKASSNMLMIQAPTWEVNPTISKLDYEIEHAKNPKSFATEYGAEFSDRVRGWIEDHKDLLDCVIPELRPVTHGGPREPFWAGVDFAVSNDGTAIALTRIRDGRIELGYHEAWYPKMKWAEVNPHLTEPVVPYALTLQNVSRLDIDEITEWFKVLSTRFFIMQGVFDQWAGPIFENALHKRGLLQFEKRHFSAAESSQAYQDAKMLMYKRQLGLYDYPRPESSMVGVGQKLHSPLITELLELQATSIGKNMIEVEAPNVAGKHDDNSDALIRSVKLVLEYLQKHPDALENSSVQMQGTQVGPSRSPGYQQFHRMRSRMHGAPNRLRTVSGYRRM